MVNIQQSIMNMMLKYVFIKDSPISHIQIETQSIKKMTNAYEQRDELTDTGKIIHFPEKEEELWRCIPVKKGKTIFS